MKTRSNSNIISKGSKFLALTQFKKGSLNLIQSTKKSAFIFFLGTFLSRISGLLRDIFMAFAFGTEPAVATFLTAYRLSHLMRRLLGEGILQTAFIPQFEEIKRDNPKKAKRFFLDLKFFLTITLILIVLIFGTSLTIAYFLTKNEIFKLTAQMLPSLIFICLFGLNASLLHCNNQLFTTSVSSVFFNLGWIAAIFVSLYFFPHQAMTTLSIGIIFASFLQWRATEAKSQAYLKEISLSTPPFSLATTEINKIKTPLYFGFLSVASTQFNNAIDALFAYFSEAEGPANLWYAIRIQQLPLSLFSIALSTALLPPLTRAIKNNEHKNFKKLLIYSVNKNLALLIPFTLILLTTGDLIVSILYQRGDFSTLSTIKTTKCLWAYTLGLIPMSLIMLFNPALYAKNSYSIATKGSFLSMCLNFFLNAFLIFGLGFGAVSVAIATSISSWCHCFYLASHLKVKIQFSKTIATCLLGLLSYYLLIKNPTCWQIISYNNPNYPTEILKKLKLLIEGGVAFGLPYITLMLYELRSRKFQQH